MTTPIAASQSDGCRGHCDSAALIWAGHGFNRPGPGAEVPRDLYRAAPQNALAFTIDRDGCGECDGARLCETHTERAARAQQYQQTLEQEMEADENTDNQRITLDSPITIGEPRTGKGTTWATQRQLEAWYTHNDHVDGLTPDYDLDREA
jgi:hypothetical protein